jgi:hypothetical protein
MNRKSPRAFFRVFAIATICARRAAATQNIRKSSAATIHKGNADAPRKLDVSVEYTLVNAEKEAVNADYNRSDVIGTVSEAQNGGNGLSRIVGGEESEPGEFPYFVEMNGCAGSLIAPTVVLTAAHCNPEKIVGKYVTVGASKKKETDNGSFKPAERIMVVDAMIHPNYGNKGPEMFLNNDFGLLLLEKPYAIESDIKLVLNDKKKIPDIGAMLDVVGMGSTEYDSPGVHILHDVAVPAITNNDCEEILGYEISKKQMCAGKQYGGKDACQGDSGGPLVMRQGNKHIQVGIVSWGINCGRFPGVYSRISEGFDWIEERVCETWQAGSSDLCGWIEDDGPLGKECRDKNKFRRDKSNKDCDWVAKRPGKRCDKKIEGRNKKYKYFCKKTCGRC